jgi:hypothetical protein
MVCNYNYNVFPGTRSNPAETIISDGVHSGPISTVWNVQLFIVVFGTSTRIINESAVCWTYVGERD